MSELQKATLQEVSADEQQTPRSEPVPVQFNPTTLRLRLTNQVEGGRSNARQRRQQTGASSNVLSMDLIFDSADEGTADSPVSVRTKTGIVEKFVVPPVGNPDPPPRLKFQWDELILIGIVESVDINFEHFASNGAPLRAKVSLSIKEQKSEYQFLQGGAGSRSSAGSTPPGGGGSAVSPGAGTNETGTSAPPSEQSAPALDGETPAEFAARQGLDPSAWRGLGADLSAGLSLEAGVEVGFSAGLSAGLGIGLSAGVQASAGVSLEAALGVSVTGGGAATAAIGSETRGKVDDDQAGKAMAAAGGVEAAIETVKIKQAAQLAGESVASFGLDIAVTTSAGSGTGTGTSDIAPTAAARAGALPMAASTRPPLVSTGVRTVTQQQSAAAAAPPPQADPRSVSYGLGVPLRRLYETAVEQQQLRVCGASSGNQVIEPPYRTDPTVAPWVALPQRDGRRQEVDAREQQKQINPCRYVSNWCDCDGQEQPR